MPLMTGSRRSASDPEDSSDEEMKEEGDEEQDEEQQDGEDEGQEGEQGEVEEYTVEKILAHRWNNGTLEYKVKWQGYEKKEDQTWEPEDLVAEVVALDKYIDKIGGRPTQTPGKRSRKSLGETATPASKKSRAKQQPKWEPPSGSWENEIRQIETMERQDDGGYICYVQWVNNEKTQHPVSTMYKRCPQKMLRFYEAHLVFRDSSGKMKAKEE